MKTAPNLQAAVLPDVYNHPQSTDQHYFYPVGRKNCTEKRSCRRCTERKKSSNPGIISTRKLTRRPPPRSQVTKTCPEATKGQTTLLTLPNEVLKMISNAVDRKELMALRSTCRLLNDNSVGRFSKEWFSAIGVFMDRSSLQRIVDIARHPLFGPCNHYIGLDPLVLLKITLGVSDAGGENMAVVGRPKSSTVREPSTSCLCEMFDDLYHEQYDMKRSCESLELLVQALTSI